MKKTPFKFGKWVDDRFKDLIKTLPQNSKVLDLGSGLGGRSVFLTQHGFKVTCVDKDKNVIESIKKECPNINAIEEDILGFDFPQEKYSLVLLLNILVFLKTDDIRFIVKNAINSLKENGLLYLIVFSVRDSSYPKFLKATPKVQGENTFYNKKTKNFVHFFTKDELVSFFPKNKILEVKDLVIKDNHPPTGKHKHHIIRMVIKK